MSQDNLTMDINIDTNFIKSTEKEIRKEIKRLKQLLQELGDSGGDNVKKINKQIKQLESMLGKAEKSTKSFSKSVGSMWSTFKQGIGVGAGIQAFNTAINLAKKGVNELIELVTEAQQKAIEFERG